MFIAFGVLVSMLGFMFMSSFALASGGQSVKSFMKSVLVLSVSFVVFIGASVMFYIEKSKIEDARTERTAVISKLVIDTVKPTFEKGEIASLKLVPTWTNDGHDPELRISARDAGQQLVLKSTDSRLEKINLEAWALDLSEGKRPSVEVFYQDGNSEMAEANFTPDGELALSPSTK